MSCDIVFVPNLLTKSADSLIFFEFQNSLIFHSIMTQPVIKKNLGWVTVTPHSLSHARRNHHLESLV